MNRLPPPLYPARLTVLVRSRRPFPTTSIAAASGSTAPPVATSPPAIAQSRDATPTQQFDPTARSRMQKSLAPPTLLNTPVHSRQ